MLAAPEAFSPVVVVRIFGKAGSGTPGSGEPGCSVYCCVWLLFNVNSEFKAAAPQRPYIMPYPGPDHGLIVVQAPGVGQRESICICEAVTAIPVIQLAIVILGVKVIHAT